MKLSIKEAREYVVTLFPDWTIELAEYFQTVEMFDLNTGLMPSGDSSTRYVYFCQYFALQFFAANQYVTVLPYRDNLIDTPDFIGDALFYETGGYRSNNFQQSSGGFQEYFDIIHFGISAYDLQSDEIKILSNGIRIKINNE